MNLYLGLATAGAASPLLIALLPKGVVDYKSYYLSFGSIIVTIALAFFAGELKETVWQFLFLQFVLFFAFVSVSRMRQRKSNFLHALASIPSNGQWFITMWLLGSTYLANSHAQGILGKMEFTNDFFILLATAIAGALAGRLVGVQWMRWIETKWEVKTESIGSENLRVLDKYTIPTLWVLVVGTFLSYSIFNPNILRDVLIVMSLGFFQNGIYALNTRLANRNHPGWPVITGIIGGIIFYVHWVFLISYTSSGTVMPLALLIPYTVATVAGSNCGASVSMFLEKILNLKADEHVKSVKKEYADITWHKKLLWVLGILSFIYVLGNEPILSYLQIETHAIIMPIPLFGEFNEWGTRTATLLFAGFIFFIQNVTHTLSSRAGNRSNAFFHATTCVLHGMVYFSVGTFVILNASFLDLIPLAILGSVTGQLFSQQLSLKIEKLLQSVMDA